MLKSVVKMISTTTNNNIIRPSIKLTQNEQRICDLLNDYTNFYNYNDDGNGNKSITSNPLILRITGGWVRDKILLQPSHDLDIAINIMTGEQFITNLIDFLKIDNNNSKKYNNIMNLNDNDKSSLFHKINKNPSKSKHLETITTKIFDLDIDFVNLRSEEYSENSRIPTIEFGTPLQDALRRDATLNSLFYNIGTGEIEDFTQKGLKDLELGILRTPMEPKKTFLDDPLRILRLIRFASKFNFSIDNLSFLAMKDNDINNAFLKKISRERIGIEFEKILLSDNPQVGLSLIQETKIDNVIFYFTNFIEDEIELNNIKEYNKIENSENYLKIMKIYDELLNNHLLKFVNIYPTFINSFPKLNELFLNNYFIKKNWFLSTILLQFKNIRIYLPNIASKKENRGYIHLPIIESIIKDGLKLGKNDSNISTIVINNMDEYKDKIIKRNKEEFKRSEIGSIIRNFNGNWEICHFVCAIEDFLKLDNITNRQEIINKYNEIYDFIEKENLKDCHLLKPLIDGKELTKLLNMRPGKWLGQINNQAILWQLDNPMGNRDEFIEYIKSILPEYV